MPFGASLVSAESPPLAGSLLWFPYFPDFARCFIWAPIGPRLPPHSSDPLVFGTPVPTLSAWICVDLRLSALSHAVVICTVLTEEMVPNPVFLVLTLSCLSSLSGGEAEAD